MSEHMLGTHLGHRVTGCCGSVLGTGSPHLTQRPPVGCNPEGKSAFPPERVSHVTWGSSLEGECKNICIVKTVSEEYILFFTSLKSRSSHARKAAQTPSEIRNAGTLQNPADKVCRWTPSINPDGDSWYQETIPALEPAGSVPLTTSEHTQPPRKAASPPKKPNMYSGTGTIPQSFHLLH